MRTCAAYIMKRKEAGDHEMVATDAADLLIEASDLIEQAQLGTVVVSKEDAEFLGLGEPMALLEPIPPPPPDFNIDRRPSGVWTTGLDTLPPPVPGPPSYRHPRVCPKCDSRAHKRVFHENNKMFLACPACAHAWEYKP
jgi:hypothetical protein